MKRILAILTVFAIILSAAACGKKPAPAENDTGTENVSVEATEATVPPTEAKQEQSLLRGTYKVPLKNIYVDTPLYHEIFAGYTELFFVDQVKLASFTCAEDVIATTPEDAFEQCFEYFQANMSGYVIVKSLGEVEKTSTTINGIDVAECKGKITLGDVNVYDAYLYAYSFVFEGLPCAIIGVVTDQTQPQNEIDEITAVVQAMMLTVRNAK